MCVCEGENDDCFSTKADNLEHRMISFLKQDLDL